MPEKPLRAHLISGIGIEIERRTDVVVRYHCILDIGRRQRSFDVVKDEIETAEIISPLNLGLMIHILNSECDAMSPGSHSLTHKPPSDNFGSYVQKAIEIRRQSRHRA